MPSGTLDALGNARYGLEGRIVTMNASDEVLPRGVIYIDGGRIAAVQPTDAPPPSGFEKAQIIKTNGTIYPGLIELHNHLSYNVLGLWAVPQPYENRDEWAGIPAYRQLISGPMTVLGKTKGMVEAVVRYVECKCLLGGVTTSQGIALFSNAGIIHFYKGVVRNAESPDATDLPAASGHIGDVEATKASDFLDKLKRSDCLLLHLSEGTNKKAHEHFEALQVKPGEWAITSALAGIHCVALTEDDYKVMHQNGAAMIWSPLSNLLLYGHTADVQAAKRQKVLMGIGSDWSPSGSKNLFGELKVARLVSAELGGLFTDLELVAMATRNAAAILKWQNALGSIEAGKHADLLVLTGRTGDPYAHLLESPETAISLVVIDGAPRYGQARLMNHFGQGTEKWKVGRSQRVLNLAQAQADPVVGALTLDAAQAKLADGLHNLKALAHDIEHPKGGVLGAEQLPEWSLLLDHDETQGLDIRPHLPLGEGGSLTGEMPGGVLAPSAPLSEILGPLELDPLTVADDPTFLKRLTQETNLPDFIKQKLPKLFQA